MFFRFRNIAFPILLSIIIGMAMMVSLCYLYINGEEILQTANEPERVQMSTIIDRDAEDYADNERASEHYNMTKNITLLSEDGQTVYQSGKTIESWLFPLVGTIEKGKTRGLADLSAVCEYDYTILHGIRRNQPLVRERTITLDLEAQKKVYDWMSDRGVKGGVFAYDYTTGEVRLCVSAPAVASDQDHSDLHDQELRSRPLYSVSPGSTQKLLTLLLLSTQVDDLSSLEYKCEGKWKDPEGKFRRIKCTGHHGVQKAADALGNSCNCWFAQAIYYNLDWNRACETLKQWGWLVNEEKKGYEKPLHAGDIPYDSPSCKLTGRDSPSIWSLIGEDSTLSSAPYQAQVAAAIASEGSSRSPVFFTDDPTKECLFKGYEGNLPMIHDIWKEAYQSCYSESGLSDSVSAAKTGTSEYNNSGTSNGKLLSYYSEKLHTAVFIQIDNWCIDNQKLDVNIFELANYVIQMLE